MTRYFFFFINIALSLNVLKSQTILITFEGTVNGTSTPLDSILVINLSQGGDTVIYFPDNALFLGTVGLGEMGPTEGPLIRSLPNPFADHTEVLLDAAGGELLLKLHDAMGRELATYSANSTAGLHRFRVICEKPGLHLLTAVQGGVGRTVRLMATEGAGLVGLSHIGAAVPLLPKSGRSLFTWAPGDELRYIGYATSVGVLHSAAIEEVPVASATRTFAMAAGATCPDSPTVTDIDGNVYTTVQIGTQCWMAANLKTTRYRDGTIIPNVTGNAAWTQLNSGAWCNFNNISSTDAIHGKLYNWYAAANTNICPLGWRVPTDAKWTILTNFLGGEAVAGGKMKAVSFLWDGENIGATNESGFSGLPGGGRYIDGNFSNFGNLAYFGHWWSASESGAEYAWFRTLSNYVAYVARNNNNKRSGYCLRCVRD